MGQGEPTEHNPLQDTKAQLVQFAIATQELLLFFNDDGAGTKPQHPKTVEKINQEEEPIKAKLLITCLDNLKLMSLFHPEQASNSSIGNGITTPRYPFDTTNLEGEQKKQKHLTILANEAVKDLAEHRNFTRFTEYLAANIAVITHLMESKGNILTQIDALFEHLDAKATFPPEFGEKFSENHIKRRYDTDEKRIQVRQSIAEDMATCRRAEPNDRTTETPVDVLINNQIARSEALTYRINLLYQIYGYILDDQHVQP